MYRYVQKKENAIIQIPLLDLADYLWLWQEFSEGERMGRPKGMLFSATSSRHTSDKVRSLRRCVLIHQPARAIHLVRRNLALQQQLGFGHFQLSLTSPHTESCAAAT